MQWITWVGHLEKHNICGVSVAQMPSAPAAKLCFSVVKTTNPETEVRLYTSVYGKFFQTVTDMV